MLHLGKLSNAGPIVAFCMEGFLNEEIKSGHTFLRFLSSMFLFLPVTHKSFQILDMFCTSVGIKLLHITSLSVLCIMQFQTKVHVPKQSWNIVCV